MVAKQRGFLTVQVWGWRTGAGGGGAQGGTSKSHRSAVSGRHRRSIRGAWSGKKGGWRRPFPCKLPRIVVFLRPGETTANLPQGITFGFSVRVLKAKWKPVSVSASVSAELSNVSGPGTAAE